ncbi:MAG: hypothetical protein M3N23_11280 [Pseudomonadota bacterium]|nr:hypothetical protein [Pseudomonadota bacterium]
MPSSTKSTQVNTKHPSDPNATPRLPHERDESDDSQTSPSRKVMEQAATDIESGQVDTDLRNRAGGVENVVQKGPAKPAEKK